MTRSGYTDSCDGWELVRWRGAVASAIRGKRGQAFLREILTALEAMPKKELQAGDLVNDAGCCAMGAVALQRGLDVSTTPPWNREAVAKLFGIAPALAAEIADQNDGDFLWKKRTPRERWIHVHQWVCRHIRNE